MSAVLLALALTLSACGGDATTGAGPSAATGTPTAATSSAAAGPSGSASTGTTSAAERTQYPVEVTNCGRTLRFDKAPTRIISGWTSSTDLLLDLGAGDSIIGQYNTSNGTHAAEFAEAAGTIPVLGEAEPTREALIAARPELIWADGEYLFDGKRLPTIDELAADGIQVMILSGFCTMDATRAKVRDVVTDLTTLGTILDLTPRADEIKADIDRQLAAVQTEVGAATPVPVAMLTTFDRAIYAYSGVYSDIAQLAGGRNIYDGTLPDGKYFNQISVEDLIRQNPTTLVYLLSGSETEESARRYLAESAPTVAAVKTGRVIFLPNSDSTNLAGVDGVVKLAAALHP